MNAANEIENVTATTRRRYFLTAISRLLAAGAIAIAAGGTALAVGPTPTPTSTPTATPSPSPSPTPAAKASPTAKQALWVANGTNVVEFGTLPGGVQDEKPKAILNSAVFGAPQGVVFDATNNLWVIDGGTVAAGGAVPPSLEEFTEAQIKNLKKVPTPTPNVQIKSAEFMFPQQAVFDGTGNMWVSDSMANKVWVITPTQLGANNNDLVFTTTIESTPPFNGALGIVLGKNGNLWVANVNDTSIFEFNAGHLPTIGSGLKVIAPDVTLNDDGNGSIQGPWALIFDQEGDLWSSNANTPFTLVEFTAAQIATPGASAPTPAITISPFQVKVSKKVTDPSLAAPNGIAFDQKSDLAAISSATPFGVAVYDKKQEATGGSLKLKSFLVGGKTTLNAPAGDNFGPDISH